MCVLSKSIKFADSAYSNSSDSNSADSAYSNSSDSEKSDPSEARPILSIQCRPNIVDSSGIVFSSKPIFLFDEEDDTDSSEFSETSSDLSLKSPVQPRDSPGGGD